VAEFAVSSGSISGLSISFTKKMFDETYHRIMSASTRSTNDIPCESSSECHLLPSSTNIVNIGSTSSILQPDVAPKYEPPSYEAALQEDPSLDEPEDASAVASIKLNSPASSNNISTLSFVQPTAKLPEECSANSKQTQRYWSKEEDLELLSAIEKVIKRSALFTWEAVSNELNNGRSESACKNRWAKPILSGANTIPTLQRIQQTRSCIEDNQQARLSEACEVHRRAKQQCSEDCKYKRS